jgi:ADP-ribose pyrophosphatase
MDSPPLHPDVEILECQTPFRGYLQIDAFRLRHRRFDGGWSPDHKREVMRRGQAVAVLLYDPARDAVVLIEQFRLPALLGGGSPWQLEVVAGMIDGDGETPQAVAARETREETGLDLIGEPLPIQRYLPSAGGSDENVHLYCGRVEADGAGGIHGLPEEHEEIRVVVKTLAEIEAMVDAGRIENGHTLVMLYWLLRHRDRVRGLWGVGEGASAGSR